MNKLILTILFLLQFSVLQAREGSVVCLHGFFRSYKCMIPMGNALRNEGLEVYLWDYKSRRGTIEQHVDQLVEVLKGIAASKPGEPIHFTTHSLGGVIVRAAVNHPDCPREAKIGKAVLLAPPNKGAHLARQFRYSAPVNWLFGKKAGQQLLHYREHHMESYGQFPPSMDVMVVAGKKEHLLFQLWQKGPNDGKVTVEETRLSTPHTHHTLHVSHHWIMTSRQSIALAKDFILKEQTYYAVNSLQNNSD
ncbi:MAG: hypothetical protein S4CHLAM2_01780 [Chlamydiales bacterium]|nr:hypothetical protein [Chlamydiales bacterium]